MAIAQDVVVALSVRDGDAEDTGELYMCIVRTCMALRVC